MGVMVDVGDHYRDVMDLGAPRTPTTVTIAEASGLVLAQKCAARVPIPPFTNSAMDGFALRSKDVHPGHALPVVADIPAGSTTRRTLPPGAAIRVMTGAPLPEGADSVLIMENTQHPELTMLPQPPAEIIPTIFPHPGDHIRAAGEDVTLGHPVMTAGEVLTPAHIGALVGLGYQEVTVHPRVKVGVMSTGSELQEPGEHLAYGKIPDSNSYLLSAALSQAGAEVIQRSLYSDNPASFLSAFDALVSRCDLVITTGGVSAGAFDVVKAALQDRGEIFRKVSMKPGKPQGFGLVGTTPVLCFPGNPVSAFVSLHLFGLPLLRKLQGQHPHHFDALFESARAGGSWAHTPGRTQFLPAYLHENTATPTATGGGSHLITSLPQARCLIQVPPEAERINPGDSLRILRLRL